MKGYFVDIDYYLRVSPSTISLEGEESASFTITSNVDYWEIIGIPEWLTSSAINGNGNATITVSATTNSTASDRTAVLTVKSSASDAKISITQKKKEIKPGEKDNQTPKAPAREINND